jgi:hypothetical protein
VGAAIVVGAMCVVAAYGAARIPKEARWPIRFGGFGFQTTIGKGAGLLMWPALGAAVASLAWVEETEFGGLVLIGLLLMLWAQLAAVLHLARD